MYRKLKREKYPRIAPLSLCDTTDRKRQRPLTTHGVQQGAFIAQRTDNNERTNERRRKKKRKKHCNREAVVADKETPQ